jgi:DNA-directed RNA polymerase specialized sigma24 family protein
VSRHARTSHERKIFSDDCPSPWITTVLDLQIALQDQFGKYSTYRGMIGRYVYVRTRDRDAADDLVQDTFTDALIGLPDADDDVVGWLLRLAARSCTKHVWGVRRQRRAAHELHEQPLPQPGVWGATTWPRL